MGEVTYVPLALEGFQLPVLPCHALVAQDVVVLLQEPAAHVRVLGLRDRVLDVGFLEPIERDNDAVDFGEGVVEVPLGGREGELDFLGRGRFVRQGCVRSGAAIGTHRGGNGKVVF